MTDVDTIVSRAAAEIAAADRLVDLETARVRYLGKKGAITALLKSLGSLPDAERRAAGQVINEARDRLEMLLDERRAALDAQLLAERLAAESLDMSLPGRGSRRGGLHPVTLTMRRIEHIFTAAGFAVHEGPEVEDEFHNFSALNIPDNHPSRAMMDTFYLPSGKLLRTHTSPVQIRALLASGAPIRMIAPGRVFRCDSDQTHTPMFHQVEGLIVDRNVSFANLKAIIRQFLEVFFDRPARVRFRPSFFPFTEPSAEVDVMSDSGRWLEVLGCGLVHPQVLRNVGVDPEEFTGLAFGLGVERFAMLRYGIDDIRLLFENDLLFLRQFA